MLRAKNGPKRRINLRMGPLPAVGVLLSVFTGIYGGMSSLQAFGQTLVPAGSDSAAKKENSSLNLPVSGDRPATRQETGTQAAAGGAAAARDDSGAKFEGSDDRLAAWEGKPVLRLEFEGVPVSRLAPLQRELAQQPNTPLRAENLRQSLRRLYATGLYDSISADGSLENGGVVLIFHGTPRAFIGVVSVIGAKGANTNALLVRTSRLTPGTRFTSSSLEQAETAMRKSLAENGYYQPSFSHKLTPHPDEQLVDIAYAVVSGPHARSGGVAVSGECGLTPEEFRHYSKL